VRHRRGRLVAFAVEHGRGRDFRFAPFAHLPKRVAIGALARGQRDAVLRSARPSDRRFDIGEIERERVGEVWIGGIIGAEKTLRLRVRAHNLDVLLLASGEPQIGERYFVDWKERDRRAVLRAHVADGRAVGKAQTAQPGAVELDEFPHDALPAQHLRAGQHEIGGRRAFAHLAAQLETDDLGDQHRHGLAEHGSLGFDAADAPP
jgi:hypothetical protein